VCSPASPPALDSLERNQGLSLYSLCLLLLVVVGMDAGISFRIDNGKPPHKKM
jgi:hypothetical protein